MLSLDPNNVDALELTGIILVATGNAGAAFQTLKAVAGIKPLDPAAQCRLANAAGQAGEDTAAIAAFRRAMIVHPLSGEAHLRALNFLAARGDPSQALLFAQRNILLGDCSSPAFSIRAKLQFGERDLTPSRRDLQRALILAPEAGNDLLPLAQLLEKSNDTNGAERLYRLFSKICAPREPQGWLVYHDLLRTRRRIAEATVLLKRALILAPAEPALWDRMTGAEWGNDDPSFAATASAMCGSRNPQAWMLVLQRLGSDSGAVHLARRAAEAMMRVNQQARRTPMIRFSMAEMEFVRGNREEARQQLRLFFKEVSEGLEKRDPNMEHDFGCLIFLYFFLFLGTVEDCARFAALVRPDVGGDTNNQIHLLKLKLLIGLVAAYRSRPHGWTSDRRRVVSLPVWGAKYVDMWLKYGLPSLFGVKNRTFWEAGEVVFHVATTPADQARLNEDPLFRKFCQRHTPYFLDVTPVLTAGLPTPSYQALTLAHWAAILIARDENADFVGLVADYIFSDGSLSFLAEQAEQAHLQAGFTVDFWVAGEAAAPVFDSLIAEDGTLSISPLRMNAIFAENSSARLHFNEAGPDLDSIPSDPSRMYTRLPNGLRIDNLQPQLFFATPELLRKFWSIGLPMTDNGLVDFVLMANGSFEGSDMLVDPERFGCIVLDFDEEERAKTGHYPERLRSSEPVRDLAEQIARSKLWSPGRKWALENPLYVAFDGAPPDRAEADRFMAAVTSRLPEPSSTGYLDMVRDIGRDEFERFLAGH